MKNQNQKFRPVLLARNPAKSCGDSKRQITILPTIISGIVFNFIKATN